MTYVFILLIMGVAFWRFRHVPLDRDYTPYAYPAIFGTPYLKDGHQDIKPPLIHWSYKCWLKIIAILSLQSIRPDTMMRALPYLGMTFATLSVERYAWGTGIVLAFLFASPSLWPHMANTEWLTVVLWSLALNLPPVPAAFLLGLSLLSNQKNLVLVAVVAWAMGHSPTPTYLLALFTPPALAGLYLLMTGRKALTKKWVLDTPKAFGKARSLKTHTLPSIRLLFPGLALMAVVLATAKGPWLGVFVLLLAATIASKQIVPHHLLLLAFPLALASTPSATLFAAFLVVWATRDGLAWLRPALTYPLTFPGYELTFEDQKEVLEWLDENTTPDETIWVNGWENQVYLYSKRKAWGIQIPELFTAPEVGKAPRVIIHCRGSAPFDYDAQGYKRILTSRLGGYSVMVKA